MKFAAISELSGGGVVEAGLDLRRVVVRSVGSASPAVAALLARALPLSPARLAHCLYRAPAVLLDGLGEPQARTICGMLEQTGLSVEVTGVDEPLTEGGADHDLAVHVADPAKFREVAAAVAAFVGCEPKRAVELLCGSPPLVLGQVSEATAKVLAERLRPLGAEVDVSRTSDARYDVFVQAPEGDLRRRIARQLSSAGFRTEPAGPIVALGIERGAAEALWSRVGAGEHWRLVDRALQRFDIQICALPETEAAALALVTLSGMPRELLPKLRKRLPVVLLESLRHEAASAALEQLTQAGVEATARLVTLLAWDVVVREAADAGAAGAVLASILGKERRLMELALGRLPARLGVSVSLGRGRWLVHELAAVGARAVLEER